MWCRRACILGCLLLLAGCGTPRASVVHDDPAMVITVFDDGFHSGFILPYGGAPLVLDPQRSQATAQLPYVEVGYGESKWLQGIDRSSMHAARLAMWPADGMLLLVNREGDTLGKDEIHGTRYWKVPLSPAGVAALFATIDQWIDHSKHYVRPPDDPQFFYASGVRYSVFCNCHDFAVRALGAAGFPFGSRLVWGSGNFDDAMDAGLRQLQRMNGVSYTPYNRETVKNSP
jgi:hypothetical protein